MIKMNSLEHAGSLMESLAGSSPGRYCFYVLTRQLRLGRLSQKTPAWYILIEFNSGDLVDGFTSEMWDRLNAKLRHARKEGILQ